MSVDNELPSGWIKTSLAEIGKVITGKTPSKNNPEDWGELIDFITPTEIRNDKKYIFNTPRKLSEIGYERFSRMILPENSVIVTCIGSDMGKIVLNKNKSLTNQQINSIIVNRNNHYDYIYYLLKSAYKILRIIADGSGSTMPILNKSNFESLSFKTPQSIEEQKAIANILTTFDDKIELLQAQNKTLETTAQTIFKEWFGKYQIGDELPEGWRVGKLGEVSLLSAGGDKPKSVSLTPNEKTNIPIYSNGITNDGLYGYTDTPKITEESITVSARGTIGFVCLRSKPFVPIVRLVTVIPKKNNLTGKYLFFLLKNANIDGTGTTQQQLTVPDFKRTEIIIPRLDLINEFTTVVDSFYDKIEVNIAQIQTLQQTRDVLLPKLMSGQLRVDEFR